MVMVIGSLGSTVGEMIKETASKEILVVAVGEEKAESLSHTEVQELILSKKYFPKFSEANREIGEKYKWYIFGNLAFQTLLLGVLAWFSSAIIIRQVQRYGRL